MGTRNQWRATMDLAANASAEYKYIKKDGGGNVVWESGANRVLNTGAGGSAQTQNDSWK
ncbi:MAG TPA: carbohydrate-binding module family 20 domain-containing protein [Albitalea sp.]